ncbi:MAG: GAF domain-containing protein [Anaerolineales bacterium]|jgi:signal transduction histidine kinase/FixJ family two-component response regulator
MEPTGSQGSSLNVIVVADVESNAQAIVERILKPSGFRAWVQSDATPEPDVLVVDVTQLRGDPLASLRNVRSSNVEAPAILLAAHFPLSRLRELFKSGVRDFLLKPYRPSELCQAITEVGEARAQRSDSQVLSGRLESMRQQLERRTEEIRMLSEIGRVVVRMDDLNQILRSVVEAASFMTDAEEAAIYLAEPDSEELVLRASKQAGERHATLQKIRTNDTLVGQVYRTGEPILRQPSMQAGPVKVQTGFLVQSTLNVPLRVENHIVGVLGVYNRLAPRIFTEHHRTLLSALSDWAGVALEYASLRRDTGPKEPAETRPMQPPTDTTPVATAEWVGGVEDAIEMLQRFLGNTGALKDPTDRADLNSLLNKLRTLLDIPVIHLDKEQTRELVDLNSLVSKTVENMYSEARQRGLEIVAERSDPIPMFRADREKIRQVLEALITAAIRRTKRGRIVLEAHTFDVLRSQSDQFPLTVNVEMHDGAWAAVRVSDSSSGLSPDTIQALTAEDTNPLSGKMGPGLSMGEIRMIVQSMSGVMWYEHTPASTSITFALPIK